MVDSMEIDVMSARVSYYDDSYKANSPLVWGDDVILQEHSPEEDDSYVSAESLDREDSKMVPSRSVEIDSKLSVSSTAHLINLSEMGELDSDKFVNFFPEAFNFFPKDEMELNDICSTLRLNSVATDNQQELNHVSSLHHINSEPVVTSDDPSVSIPSDCKDSTLVDLQNVQQHADEPLKVRRTRTSARRSSQQQQQQQQQHHQLTMDDPYPTNFCNVKDYHTDKDYHAGDYEARTPGGASSSTYTVKRRRNSSEHSVISNGSYDDPDSPYKRKRRRYEEDPSDDPAFEKSRKNAIIAKRNREKKKQMMEQMESRCEKLSTENDILDSDNGKLRQRVETLEEEVFYLKSVLANQSSLSQVLSTLKTVNNLRLSSSFEATKYKKNSRGGVPTAQQLKVSGGICLHVDGNNVSMELCQKCAQMACGAPRSAEASGKARKSTWIDCFSYSLIFQFKISNTLP